MSRSETDRLSEGTDLVESPPRSLLLQYSKDRSLAIKEAAELREYLHEQSRELELSGEVRRILDGLAEMKTLKTKINLIDFHTQEILGEIFRGVRAELTGDPTNIIHRADSNTWIARKKLTVEGEEIPVVISFIGENPEQARRVRICPVGLHSYLEVNHAGGRTYETLSSSVPNPGNPDKPLTEHELVSFPGTMHDAVFYRKIANSL